MSLESAALFDVVTWLDLMETVVAVTDVVVRLLLAAVLAGPVAVLREAVLTARYIRSAWEIAADHSWWSNFLVVLEDGSHYQSNEMDLHIGISCHLFVMDCSHSYLQVASSVVRHLS